MNFDLDIHHDLWYRRKTHDENGRYRDLPMWKHLPDHIGGIIHHLDGKNWMGLYDIMGDIYSYAAQYPFENGLDWNVDPLIVQANLKFLATCFDMVEIKKCS